MGFFDQVGAILDPTGMVRRAIPYWSSLAGSALQSPTVVGAAEAAAPGLGEPIFSAGESLADVANRALVEQDTAAEQRAARARKITGQAPPWQAPKPAVTEPPPAPARTSESVVGAPYPLTPTDLPPEPRLDVTDSQGNVVDPMEWKRSAFAMEHETKPRAGGAIDPNLGRGSFDVREGPGGYVPSVQVPVTAGMNFDTYQNELARLEGTNQLAAQILRERWAVDHPAVAANTEQQQAEANIDLTRAQAEKARHTVADDYEQAIRLVPTAMLQVAQEWGIDPTAIMESKKEEAHQKSIILARADPELKARKIDMVKNPQEFETIRKKWELRLLANYVTQEADKRMNRAQVPVESALARNSFAGYGYGNQ